MAKDLFLLLLSDEELRISNPLEESVSSLLSVLSSTRLSLTLVKDAGQAVSMLKLSNLLRVGVSHV